MAHDKETFSQDKFENLINTENWLGAWTYLKITATDQTEGGIMTGLLANGLQKALSAARMKDDKEKISYLRSLLAWILRDYPGLASLYREQIRPSSFSGIPDGIQDVWREFNDILSGRKTVDENFKERMRDVSSHLAKDGLNNETFQNIAREAESELRKGMEGVRDFLGNFWGSNPTTPPPESESEIPARKIKIQDADDPVPGAIHVADPPDEQLKP